MVWRGPCGSLRWSAESESEGLHTRGIPKAKAPQFEVFTVYSKRPSECRIRTRTRGLAHDDPAARPRGALCPLRKGAERAFCSSCALVTYEV